MIADADLTHQEFTPQTRFSSCSRPKTRPRFWLRNPEQRELLVRQIDHAAIDGDFMARQVDAHRTDLDPFLAGEFAAPPLGTTNAHVQLGRYVRNQDEIIEAIVSIQALGLAHGNRDETRHFRQRCNRANAHQRCATCIELVERFD